MASAVENGAVSSLVGNNISPGADERNFSTRRKGVRSTVTFQNCLDCNLSCRTLPFLHAPIFLLP